MKIIAGAERSRPAFNELLREAEAKRFNVIICKSQSRFCRDLAIVETLINERFAELGIRFIGLSDNTDTAIRENRSYRSLIGIADEIFLQSTSSSIRSVFEKKMSDGEIIASFAKYGYKKDEKDKHHLVVDENVRGVLELIRNLYFKGYGYKKIADYLNEQKIDSPALYKKKQGCKLNIRGNQNFLWCEKTISTILKDKTYIGYVVQGKTQKLSYKSKKRLYMSDDKIYTLKEKHEAIYSEEDFEKIQKIMYERRRASCKTGKAHIFSGILKCEHCGNGMYRKDDNFRCRLHVMDKSKCSVNRIKYEEIESQVLKKINLYIKQYANMEDSIKKFQTNNVISRKVNNLKKQIKNFEKSIENIDHCIKNILILESTDILNDENIKTQIALLQRDKIEKKNEIAILNSELEKLQNADILKKQKEKIFAKYKHLKKLDSNIVQDLIEKITVADTGENRISIDWKF